MGIYLISNWYPAEFLVLLFVCAGPGDFHSDLSSFKCIISMTNIKSKCNSSVLWSFNQPGGI